MNIKYCDKNPLINPENVTFNSDFRVIGTFNPGVTKFNDEIILLARIALKKKGAGEKVIAHVWKGKVNTDLQFSLSEVVDLSDARVIKTKNKSYLTSLSVFGIFRSKDGINFTFDKYIYPFSEYEEYGIEDARISKIGDTYYITYSGVSSKGISGRLMTTKDFINFERVGNLFGPDNKDICFINEPIDSKYYVINRPCLSDFAKPSIWLSEIVDFKYVGRHFEILTTRDDMWDSTRIGACFSPIKTKEGFLLLYHGADINNVYSVGAILLDLKEPWKVLKRTYEPLVSPINSYEINGFFKNVIFPCGAIVKEDDIIVYYGSADKYVCMLTMNINEIMNTLK